MHVSPPPWWEFSTPKAIPTKKKKRPANALSALSVVHNRGMTPQHSSEALNMESGAHKQHRRRWLSSRLACLAHRGMPPPSPGVPPVPQTPPGVRHQRPRQHPHRIPQPSPLLSPLIPQSTALLPPPAGRRRWAPGSLAAAAWCLVTGQPEWSEEGGGAVLRAGEERKAK